MPNKSVQHHHVLKASKKIDSYIGTLDSIQSHVGRLTFDNEGTLQGYFAKF